MVPLSDSGTGTGRPHYIWKAEGSDGERGLHFKIPLIQQVQKVNTTIQGLAIGYEEESNDVVEPDGIMITEDYNFIDVDFYIEYRIADPVQYLSVPGTGGGFLKNIAQGDIRSVISSYSVDEVLTTGKSEIQSKIKEDIMADLEKQIRYPAGEHYYSGFGTADCRGNAGV